MYIVRKHIVYIYRIHFTTFTPIRSNNSAKCE